jgi:molybdate-binding protein/DNA-binding XRE family transcriptional regulator
MKQKQEVPAANALAAFRKKRGLSASELAQAVGVSRQTVYAMEAGDYVPNTSVALKLARVLQTSVEELFHLPETDVLAEPPSQLVTMITGDEGRTGERVQICRVDERLTACGGNPAQWSFAPADGVVTSAGTKGKTKVQNFHPEHEFKNRILIAGCDPGMPVLSRHMQLAGIELVLAHRNSSQALKLLADGSIHVAGTHLQDEQSGEWNMPQIRKQFSANSVAVISFATWQMGLVVSARGPKKIGSVLDLGKAGVTIVNREMGAGSRQLLDAQLRQAGLQGDDIKGYDRIADGHLPAAWHVSAGLADCCVATEAAARAFGLHFVPLVSERYDLVLRRKHLETPGVQILLETLNRLSFRRELNSLGGYDTSATGQRML